LIGNPVGCFKGRFDANPDGGLAGRDERLKIRKADGLE
jgi:hypothetical protein